MSEKHEWRKQEKPVYLPKNKPEIIDVPEYKFLTINGEGSPGDEFFTECISTLYPLAYAIKMQPKNMEVKPNGYFDFTVYPLEGVWDINDNAKKNFSGTINLADLICQLMIRQPDFVDEKFYYEMLDLVKKKKPNPLLDKVEFKSISEGRCIQMLHLGKFEDESASFEKMELFAKSEGLTRVSKVHREIYLSDARKILPEKLKTVLRFQVK